MFNTGAYEDAISAYSNTRDIESNVQTLILRAKCFMLIKELNSALGDLEKILVITEGSAEALFDLNSLTALKLSVESDENSFVEGYNQLE